MTTTAQPAASAASIEMIPLDAITPAKDNPRRKIGDVAELAQSIETLGLLQPLVVTPRENGYLLVCGARRHAAARKLKLAVVPAIVRDFTEAERQEAMLIENLQRTDLAPTEEAETFGLLVSEHGYTQRQLAERIGRSQGHVSKRLALLELPDEIREALDSGGITHEQVAELGRLKDHPKVLLRVWKNGAGPGLEWRVRDALDTISRDAKIKATRDRLKSGGAPLVDVKGSHFNLALPAGHVVIGKGYHQLDIDAGKHAKEACHAVGVDPTTGDVLALCSNPGSHDVAVRDVLAGSNPDWEREQARQAKAREQLAQRQETRRAFLTTLIAGKVPRGDILQLAVRAQLEDMEQAWGGYGDDVPIGIAAGLLGIETAGEHVEACAGCGCTEDQACEGGCSWHSRYLCTSCTDDQEAVKNAAAAVQAEREAEPERVDAAIYELATKNEASAQRVLFALAASLVETSLDHYGNWTRGADQLGDTHPATAYMTFLQAHGYKPSAAEKKAAKAA